MKIKMMLAIFMIFNGIIFGQTNEVPTQTLFNFNFGLTVGPAFNGADFNATIYDIDETYGTYWLNSIGAYAGINYYFDRLDQYFIKDLYLYSKLGFESVSGANEKTVAAGFNFFNGTLEQTYLINTLNTSLLFSNLSFGVNATTLVDNLSVFAGINFGILIYKDLDLKSQLQNNSLEIINPANSVNYADNLSAMQFGLNLGATYKFFTSIDSSFTLDAIFNTKFGVNNLLDLSQNGKDRSFGTNSISLGIQLNLHNKKKKDTPKEDTIPKITNQFNIDYLVRNSNSDEKNLYVDINTVKSSYILHPIIYYDDETAIEPKLSYKFLSGSTQRAYIKDRVDDLYSYENFEDFYYDVLNQAAYQVFNKANEQITIIYPPGINNVGLLRAQSIKKYFNEIWNIAENRIKIQSGSTQKNTLKLELRAINRLIEYGSKKEYAITSEKLIFNVKYPDLTNFKNWDLRLQHFKNNGLKTVLELDDNRKTETIEINTKENSEIVLSNTNYLEYIFKLKTTESSKESMGKIGIVFNNNANDYKKLYGKITDLRNNIDNPKRIFANNRDIEIYSNMESTANEIAKIIGINKFTYKNIEQNNDIILSDYFMIKYK